MREHCDSISGSDLTRPLRLFARRTRSALAPAGLLVLMACGSDPPARAELAPDPTTRVVLEVGARPEELEVEIVFEAVTAALTTEGGRVEVYVADGSNADMFSRLRIPGTTAAGELVAEANNEFARADAVAKISDDVKQTLTNAFEDPPSFDTGRDLLGGVERAGLSAPSHLIVLTTSGGVHRTGDQDFLNDVPDVVELDLPPDIEVLVLGVGDVPTPEGVTPARGFTRALREAWDAGCAAYGPTCEVAS